MSFITQTNDWTCSPVALYNVQEWASVCNKRSLRYLINKCKTDKTGTSDNHFEAALKNIPDITTIKIDTRFNLLKWMRNILLYPDCAFLIAHKEIDTSDMHHSLWLSEYLGINVEAGDVYTKNISMFDVVAVTPISELVVYLLIASDNTTYAQMFVDRIPHTIL